MAQKFDARQTISRDVLSQLLGINGTELDDLLRAINKEFNAPLRISASSPADSKINFQPSEVEAADLAAKNITPISSQIPSFVASTIDFQTGATTGGTINITFPNSTVGFFRRIGFSLDASGTIQAIFSAEAASLGALANAGTVFVKGALPIGWIDLEATAASPGRFKTAGSATNIIEHKVSGSNRVHRIMGGGGTSTGSGSGTGDDINALTFKASFTDLFSDLPTDSVSAVDYTSGKTDSTTYDIVNTYHRLAYDATRLLSGTGTAMTLNLAPAFTIKIGDMVIFGSEARRISALSSQTSFTIESAFSTNPSSSACTLSQAVYSKDLNNFAGDGIAVSTAFNTNISQILMTYEDTSAANDIIFDANAVAVIGYTASSDGTNFTNVNVRPQNLSDSQSIVNLPTSGTNLYVRMFANKSSGAGSVNILGYKVFFHRDLVYADGSAMNQAYARTDGSGTQVNISAISVVGGKTRIKTSFSFPVAVNSGKSNGSIKVYLDGQKLPRFVDATVSITGYYKEIDQNTIELDADYSSMALECEIIQDVAVVDASDTNTTNVDQLQETLSEGTQGFVKTSQLMNATSTVGTPAAGTFYSTISNRAAIPDLTQDLKVRMGVERIMVQQLYKLENEVGPNGEAVYAVPNDSFGQVRFVGTASSFVDSFSQYVRLTYQNDYCEVTFYGTGLNILVLQPASASAQDARASVDGGAEGGNIFVAYSQILTNRNYAPNMVVPVVSNLPLGVHTVKIRNQYTNTLGIHINGFETLMETTSLRVQPGISYLSGRKLTTSAQQTAVYNSSFESGTLGTRGGRVVVYQKSDGSIAKAVQPVNASQANLTSADHSNEEVARVYYPREFGAGRTDDFSRATASGTYAFTLDDGTTSLAGSGVGFANTANTPEGIFPAVLNNFIQFTFVGTGCDISIYEDVNSTADTAGITVDNVSIGTLDTLSVNGRTRTHKLVSGLPYGTHTVKINRNTTGSNFRVIRSFTVYQPKKPSIPAGAVELADYNVMANFSANTTQSAEAIATGVLRKSAARELAYVGTYTDAISVGTGTGGSVAGYRVLGAVASNTIRYTFFGTGFDLRMSTPVAVNTFTVAIDGTNPTAAGATATGFYGQWTSFVASTGVATSNGTGQFANGLWVSGLPLGLHTVVVTANGASSFGFEGIDIITPIYSPKSNLYGDIQNTLLVGSNAISDNRKTTLIKDSSLQQKAWAQATGVSGNVTTTSTSPVPLPDMSVTLKVTGTRVRLTAQIACSTTTGMWLYPYVNGQRYSNAGVYNNAANPTFTISMDMTVNPGVNKFDIYWVSQTGASVTAYSDGNAGRILTVSEV